MKRIITVQYFMQVCEHNYKYMFNSVPVTRRMANNRCHLQHGIYEYINGIDRYVHGCGNHALEGQNLCGYQDT